MPSEQRLHPATLLFDVGRQLRAFALPALLVIFGAGRSSGWEVWLVVLLVPATIVSFARYLSFRMRYDERELVIRSGMLFRNERRIPLSRIQNIDAVQNVLHRLLGVVEVRVETGGGSEEEARLSVLPRHVLDELRQHVFAGRTAAVTATADSASGVETGGDTLVHLSLRELLLCGFLENKGMVLIAALFGVLMETGLFDPASGAIDERTTAAGRGFFRQLITTVFTGGPIPVGRIAIVLAGIVALLLFVRVVSMLWALVRLYDFRLTRIGEDLRSEYGLFTRVSATVPIRRVQALTITAGPLHRWLGRTTVRVTTAGGTGGGAAQGREWLAPLITDDALPHLIRHIVPGFDYDAVTWQPVHPRAFGRAVRPMLIVSLGATLLAAVAAGWAALGVAIVMLAWSVVSARQYVAHLGWAEADEVVLMRSGWIRRQVTLARVNKIQAVRLHESPFDRRAAMAGVRVDTAGAGALDHRVDIPFLDRDVARGLAGRLAAAAASTSFRW